MTTKEEGNTSKRCCGRSKEVSMICVSFSSRTTTTSLVHGPGPDDVRHGVILRFNGGSYSEVPPRTSHSWCHDLDLYGFRTT